MLKRMRPGRPSPAMIVAIIALVGAFGGSAVADEAVEFAKTKLINGKRIKNRTITAGKIKRNALGGTEINESKLAVVPNANKANSATGATNATNATNATSAGNADKLDGTDSTGFQRGVRWAQINGSDGAVVSQSGGISSVAPSFTGRYFVNFNSIVSGKGVFATSSDKDLQFGGTLEVSPCGTGTGDLSCTGLVGAPADVNNGNWVTVFSNNAANSAGLNHSFYVMVIQ